MLLWQRYSPRGFWPDCTLIEMHSPVAAMKLRNHFSGVAFSYE